jgi:hypothetical protein
MSFKENKKVSRVRWLWNKVRYGLILQGIRNRLGRTGLVFLPYYWVREGEGDCPRPEIRGNSGEYSLVYLGEKDIKSMGVNKLGYTEEKMLEDLRNGKKCIGIKHKGEVAAFMFIELNDFMFKNKVFRIKANEAYLFNMHTMEHYRGRNLAPYLRYHSYELLRNEGRDTFYSISEYLNASTIKFKKKLNARHLELFFHIDFFGKFNRTIKLRTY